MTIRPTAFLFGVAFWAATSHPARAQSPVILGEPPRPPADVSRLPKGPPAKAITGGFTVNTALREEARSFYIAVYAASEGVSMNSTADVPNCVPGTNATAYREAVVRRINWFRAMAGLPASVSLDDTFNSKAQAAALIMSANTNLSHAPPPSWRCYTSDGADGAANGNLALGNAGPDAITAYIWDAGANNAFVGHRRWLLYPQTQVMGTGDVPGQAGRTRANATWIFDGNFWAPRPPTRQPFVSWPPPGFVPYQTVFGRWSFAYPDADFSNATVSFRSNGVPLSVFKETLANGSGENTLVWIPAGLDPNGATRWSQPATDTVYSVTVSNIAGLSTNRFSYTVTVFDPAVPGADFRPPIIAGTNRPVVGQANLYTFSAVSNATGYQWRQTRRQPFPWSDGAENGLTNFVVSAATNLYAVRVTSPVAAGSYAFHLAHAQTADQTLLLNRTVLGATNTQLTFKSQLGWATADQMAKVQASLDEGVSWLDLYSQAGNGTAGELSFNSRSVSLTSLAGKTVLLRFNYHYESSGPNGYYSQTDPGIGWYLDDLALVNAEELSSPVTLTTATTNFVFSPSQAGNYNLDVRALLFTDFPLDWGPGKAVTATNAPMVRIIQTARPTPNQLRLDFSIQNLTPSTFQLLWASQITGPWSNDLGAVLTTNTPGASYRFTTTTSGLTNRFYRVRAP